MWRRIALLKNGTIDVYAYKPCYCPGQSYIARGPWNFESFCNIFLPNISEDQKKVLPSKHGAPVPGPCGKSGTGYCIKFIKKLDEGLR